MPFALPHQHLLGYFHDTVEAFPTRPATYFSGHTITYAQLAAEVARVAGGLHAAGVKAGDRVAVLLPNCPQHLITVLAVWQLGATAVEHNPQFTAHELDPLFAHHGAAVAIVVDSAASTVCGLESAPATIITVALSGDGVWEALAGQCPAAPNVDADFPALILYTSGTTGAPKGVVLTHANLAANAAQVTDWIPGFAPAALTPASRRQERFLAALPMFHSYGFTMAISLGLVAGAEISFLDSPTPAAVVDHFLRHHPTYLPAVPTLYARILDEAQRRQVSLHGVTLSISGAATLPAELVTRWEAATGGLLVEGYGLTECSPVLTINPISAQRRAGCIGKLVRATQARLADPDNLDADVTPGTPGELLVRGPQVFAGYLDNAQATAQAFHDGWLRTGDMAVQEDEGFLRLVGRLKEVINTSGFNVYPPEVEEVLRAHPALADAAVIGRPRPGQAGGSEDVVACVILAPGAHLDTAQVRQWCRQRLARYKVPRDILVLDSLGADGLGKVRRAALKKQLFGEE